jgi:hypothetical protein
MSPSSDVLSIAVAQAGPEPGDLASATLRFGS